MRHQFSMARSELIHLTVQEPFSLGERWPRSFGQFSEIFKWSVRGNHAADLIAGSVAKYASSCI